MVVDMSLLTRDQILQAQDIAREEISVPEWGGSVLVRGLTGQERDAYEATIMRLNGTNAQMNLVNARAKLVARSIIDEEGNRLFGDDDVALLAKKSAAALERVFNVAQRLSGLTSSDLDELAKASANGQPEGLPTSWG
jgi:hypothetical protein